MNFPQFERLRKFCEASLFDAGDCDGLDRYPGNCVLFFPGDPARHPESPDVAVILPEISTAFPGRFSVVLVEGGAEMKLQERFGFSVKPALVFLRDGGYVGTMTGIRDWKECLEWFGSMLDSPVTRPPMTVVLERG